MCSVDNEFPGDTVDNSLARSVRVEDTFGFAASEIKGSESPAPYIGHTSATARANGGHSREEPQTKTIGGSLTRKYVCSL